MKLFRAIPICLYLLEAIVEATDLPKLPNNELLVGQARYLPNTTILNCGQLDAVTGTAIKHQVPDQVLTSLNFGQYAFTAGPIQRVRAITSTFSYAEVKGGKGTMQALQEDMSGEIAYWLPQGGVIDIPKEPTVDEPKYVFTPDFSGCSWTITPMTNGNMRIRHVEGDKEARQFNNLSVEQKGGNTTYAMQYMDYGYVVELKRLLESVRAYAYMHFDGTRWTLNLQRHTCAPITAGGYEYNERHLLIKMKMAIPKKTTYKPIASTKAFTIPFQ